MHKYNTNRDQIVCFAGEILCRRAIVVWRQATDGEQEHARLTISLLSVVSDVIEAISAVRIKPHQACQE